GRCGLDRAGRRVGDRRRQAGGRIQDDGGSGGRDVAGIDDDPADFDGQVTDADRSARNWATVGYGVIFRFPTQIQSIEGARTYQSVIVDDMPPSAGHRDAVSLAPDRAGGTIHEAAVVAVQEDGAVPSGSNRPVVDQRAAGTVAGDAIATRRRNMD